MQETTTHLNITNPENSPAFMDIGVLHAEADAMRSAEMVAESFMVVVRNDVMGCQIKQWQLGAS